MAGIGYCFGGGMLLNIARMGEGLKGIVSFHGSLLGTPADKNLLHQKYWYAMAMMINLYRQLK